MSKHSVNFSVSFMGRSLTAVESAKDLGVFIDSHMTYDTHICYLVSSCLSKLVQISCVKNSFDRDTIECYLVPQCSGACRYLFYQAEMWTPKVGLWRG